MGIANSAMCNRLIFSAISKTFQRLIVFHKVSIIIRQQQRMEGFKSSSFSFELGMKEFEGVQGRKCLVFRPKPSICVLEFLQISSFLIQMRNPPFAILCTVLKVCTSIKVFFTSKTKVNISKTKVNTSKKEVSTSKTKVSTSKKETIFLMLQGILF
jgi:hypothetical protein